ncbi:hypothetical protein HDV01_007262 [Terramyces sp. JEL0728]|nr:hypothetical protein HDV01_007262 [Terramyces sp. JEL0728]
MDKLFESKTDIPNENIVTVVANVGLYDGNDKLENYSNGSVTITSHRILYQPSTGSPSTAPVQILLSRITSHSTFAGFMMQSPKIILTVKQVLVFDWTCSVCNTFNNGVKCLNCGVSRPEIPAQCTSCTFINEQDALNCQICGNSLQVEQYVLKLSLRSGGLQETISAIEKALQEKLWLKKDVGVSMILNKKQQEQKKMSEMNESFSDLKTLMEKASEMTRLADLITAKLGTEHDEFSNSLAKFGVNVQVTGNYHAQLSAEISEFLARRNESILTLCDLYCLYNRVRGISLISPTDLLKACSLLDKDYLMKEFSSGLKIVQKKDDDCVERIIKEANGDSVGSLAKRLGLSLLIVKESLMQESATPIVAPATQTATPPIQVSLLPIQTVGHSIQSAEPPAQTIAPPAQIIAPPAQTALQPAQTVLQPAQIVAQPTETVEQPRPLFCGDCGTKIDPQSKFCGGCGAKYSNFYKMASSNSQGNLLAQSGYSQPVQNMANSASQAAFGGNQQYGGYQNPYHGQNMPYQPAPVGIQSLSLANAKNLLGLQNMNLSQEKINQLMDSPKTLVKMLLGKEKKGLTPIVNPQYSPNPPNALPPIANQSYTNQTGYYTPPVKFSNSPIPSQAVPNVYGPTEMQNRNVINQQAYQTSIGTREVPNAAQSIQSNPYRPGSRVGTPDPANRAVQMNQYTQVGYQQPGTMQEMPQIQQYNQGGYQQIYQPQMQLGASPGAQLQQLPPQQDQIKAANIQQGNQLPQNASIPPPNLGTVPVNENSQQLDLGYLGLSERISPEPTYQPKVADQNLQPQIQAEQQYQPESQNLPPASVRKSIAGPDNVVYFQPGANDFENLGTSRAASTLPGANFIVVQSDTAVQSVNNSEYVFDPNTGKRINKMIPITAPGEFMPSAQQPDQKLSYNPLPLTSAAPYNETIRQPNQNLPYNQVRPMSAVPSNEVVQSQDDYRPIQIQNLQYLDGGLNANKYTTTESGQLVSTSQHAPIAANEYVLPNNMQNANTGPPVYQDMSFAATRPVSPEKYTPQGQTHPQNYYPPNKLNENYNIQPPLSDGTYTPPVQQQYMQPPVQQSYPNNTQVLPNSNQHENQSIPAANKATQQMLYDDLQPLINSWLMAKDYEIDKVIKKGNNIEVQLKKAKKPPAEPVPPTEEAIKPQTVPKSKQQLPPKINRKHHFLIGILVTLIFPVISSLFIFCIKTPKNPYSKAYKMFGATCVYLLEAGALFIYSFLIVSCLSPKPGNYVFGYNNPYYVAAENTYNSCAASNVLPVVLGFLAAFLALVGFICSIAFAIRARKALAKVGASE